MRLPTSKEKHRPPLRTVTEIAEILGVSMMQLAMALRADGAPQCKYTGKSAGHATGRGRSWYDPKEVVRWYREFEKADPAAKRREYQREYHLKRKSNAASSAN